MQRALLFEGRIMHVKVDPGRPAAFSGGCRRIVIIIVAAFQIGEPIERGWQRHDVARRRLLRYTRARVPRPHVCWCSPSLS